MIKQVLLFAALVTSGCGDDEGDRAVVTPRNGDQPPPPKEIPPTVEVPCGLQVCFLQAELCVQKDSELGTKQPSDKNPIGQGWQQCISDYEDCSYNFPESGEPNCYLTNIWCRLELDSSQHSKAWIEYCESAYKQCPISKYH